MDGTYKEASYAGCGCAGSEIMTLEDEVRRTQKVYSDMLGRQWKTETLDYNDAVYATSVNVYNSRDQVVRVKQYAGQAPVDASSTNEAASCPTGSCQETTMSYDGYGRVQARHVPQQDANTNTSFEYNADDTVHSVTDARGATATYAYNNGRRLLTGITYSAPSGVTAAPSVSFAYDAVGNRISMNDGIGTKSYAYNSISQLTSESRAFPVGTFTLSYDYNIAGELKKITDSTNMTINYSFDNTGRLNGVTGSDNVFAGVSTYASGFQYRAWGGLKTMADGVNHSSNLIYNAKLQPAHFDVSGSVVSQNYDYYDDGKISFVHNTTDTNFDRSYFYDHARRLTENKTGAMARGVTGDTPYHETFGYDAFANLTARSSNDWNAANTFGDAAVYVNTRRQGWGYDADGRNTSIGLRTTSFDAAGRQISMSARIFSAPSYTVAQANNYDGDGVMVKEVDTQSNIPNNPTTTYYLRSSVLQGAIIEELDGNGQKVIGYVYSSSGQLLARQDGNAVFWKHMTPGATSEYELMSNGGLLTSRKELDPVGADVNLTAPEDPPPTEGPGDLDPEHFGGAMDGRRATFYNPGAGCLAYGFSGSCSGPMAQINAGFWGARGYDLPGQSDNTAQEEARYQRLVADGYDQTFNHYWLKLTLASGQTIVNPTQDQFARTYAIAYGADSGSVDLEHNIVTIYGGAEYFAEPQNTGFSQSDLKRVTDSLKLALAMSDASKGKNQKKCDEALKKLSNGKISSLNSLVSQYIASGAGQNIFDGRKVSAGSFGTDSPTVPAFVKDVGTSNVTTYLNSRFFNFTAFGGDQAKAIVILHEAVHQFGGLRDVDFDPRQKPDQIVGRRNITNAIIDNCYPALKETFRGLQL